jgi:hypothetical protein
MADNTNQDQPSGPALDNSLQLAVLGQLLKKERDQTATTIESLASLLQAAVPDRVEVIRGGFFWNTVRPVETLKVSLDDASYHIAKSKHGAPTATKSQISRGITLKSTTISMEVCITEIVAKLTEFEKSSAATRIALNNFVAGR